MGKKKNETIENVEIDLNSPKPRLKKLIIKNFRAIGDNPVEIELDDIVVLVGPNNVGKSSILRAYEIVMSEGSKEADLVIEDFPNGKIIENKYPEIELQTIVYDNSPGEDWLLKQENVEQLVRERWIWKEPGKPKRQGFHKDKKDWDEKVPWGAPNVANSRRPEPHRIDAFDTPENQTSQIISILKAVIEERVKSFKSKPTENTSEETEFEKLLKSIKIIQTSIVKESENEISKVQEALSAEVSKVFPSYEVKFDAKAEDELEKTISLFKANPQLLMGPKDGFYSNVDRQGSGARRTLLWTALKIVSETKSKQKNTTRPHILLIDEPEICLHPSAIRDACKVLYDLPQTSNWQVMTTTHSPQFIDLSRDNTTIIRVDKQNTGEIAGTTLFRPVSAKLSLDDKENLKMLNIYDPYVGEFFFGGKVIIVEGDTEYTAFRHIISVKSQDFKDIHIIRARGKSTIVTLIKILNQFGTNFSVLHDSDIPQVLRDGKPITNPAWTKNIDILNEVNNCDGRVRLVANITNFETAYFNQEAKADKPYNAISKLKINSDFFNIVEQLLIGLIDHSKPLPTNAIEWKSIDELKEKIK